MGKLGSWVFKEATVMMDRRDVLKLGAGTVAFGSGAFVGIANAQGKPVVNLQLGWLLSGNQLGEACAKQLGYYDQEGIALAFQPGGPNIDGVAIVASGKFEG